MNLRKLYPGIVLLVTLIASGTAYPNDLHANSHIAEGHCKHHQEMHKLWAQLPEEKRKLLHDTMMQVHAQNEPLHEKIKRLHKEQDALLVAPKFDKDAYLDKSKKLGELHAKMKTNMQSAFASVAAQFTLQERKILVSLDEMRHHRGAWHHDKGMKKESYRHDEDSGNTSKAG